MRSKQGRPLEQRVRQCEIRTQISWPDIRAPIPPIACCLITFALLLACPTSVLSQAVIATIPLGGNTVAVNPITGLSYTATCILNQRKAATNGSVTVIDDKTHAVISTITAGVCPSAIVVNPATNKIYVANAGQTSIWCGGTCFNSGSITIIDGTSNVATEISDPNAEYPAAIAVNSTTNRIYVANRSSNVTVIDGGTNTTTTITDPNVAAARLSPFSVTVNQATNKIYVANNGLGFDALGPGNVTVIDGATNSTATVTDPNAFTPYAVAVNPKTNKVYVANAGNGSPNSGNVTIIDGATNFTSTVADADGVAPQAIAVNPVTNKIYVANINDMPLSENGGVTVIDGATNSLILVKDPNAIAPVALAVDEVTNKVYVANEGSRPEFGGNNPGCVTVIDGTTDSTTTIIDAKASGPKAVAVNPVTNEIYVANRDSADVTIIDGGNAATVHTLAVLLAGSGNGTVTGGPGGINCGTTCTEIVASGTAVSLNALASSASLFAGWTGPCTGTASCDLRVTVDQFVTATFTSKAVTVPNVVGLTQAAATTAITGAGFAVGTVNMQSSTAVLSGSVISESPAAATNATAGSAVDLVVSTGGSTGNAASGASSGGAYGGGGELDCFALAALLAALMIRHWRSGRNKFTSSTSRFVTDNSTNEGVTRA